MFIETTSCSTITVFPFTKVFSVRRPPLLRTPERRIHTIALPSSISRPSPHPWKSPSGHSRPQREIQFYRYIYIYCLAQILRDLKSQTTHSRSTRARSISPTLPPIQPGTTAHTRSRTHRLTYTQYACPWRARRSVVGARTHPTMDSTITRKNTHARVGRH